MTEASNRNMLARAHALLEELIAWRRDFHMHPELSFREHRTAQVVADELRRMGVQVETGVGKTGVVARIGKGSPVVGVRADMDALPIEETNDVPYASRHPGVMHACGHDAHTAILLGVARLLSSIDDRPPGEVRLLFQPSEEDWDEEIKSGAMRMIEDGALEGVNAVIALHIDPSTPPGTVGVVTGHSSAADDTFYMTLIGKGGHGAYPHAAVDPISILAQVINAVHNIRARRINPIRAGVVSIGAIHAGDAPNVIPERVEMRGIIRSFDEETRAHLAEELERACNVARALGGDYELSVQRGYPSVYNAPEVAAQFSTVARDLLGPDAVRTPEPTLGAEDFSYMAQLAPGAMVWLGAKRDEEVSRTLHSPNFDLDESALPVGAAVLAETACRLLKALGA